MKFHVLAVSLLAPTGLATPVRRDTKQAIYTLRLSSPDPTLNGLYLTPHPNSTTLTVTSSTHNTVRFFPVRNPATGLSELRTADSGATLAVVGANGLLDFARLADPAAVTVPEGTTVDWTSFRLDAGSGTVRYAGGGGEGRWAAFPSPSSEGGTGPVKREPSDRQSGTVKDVVWADAVVAGVGAAVKREPSDRQSGTVKDVVGADAVVTVAGAAAKREEAWSVKWKDANAWTIQNYLPVDLVYELVDN